MRKTKIICTLGPSTNDKEMMRQLILNGMNVARFNFSHADHEEHKSRLVSLRAVREELNMPVATLLDTKGPEIRLKSFKNDVEILKEDQTFTLTTRDVSGTNEICSITYKDLPSDVEVGGSIMLDDGLIQLTITDKTATDIACVVVNGGKIKSNKGVNVPGTHLTMPYMSTRDKNDIIFAIENEFDFIAASFVRTAQDIHEIRALLAEYNSPIRIIAKIENREGVDNLDSILSVADAVMVARGDLGVEIDFTELPGIQKTIIDRSFAYGRPIITATQMLESMIENPRPTRAETSDVANAIYDGTSAIMLSGETAAGKYPIAAVRTMAAIAERTENDPFYLDQIRRASSDSQMSISDAMAHAAVTTANDVHAKAIVTVTSSGTMPRMISKYRPQQPIIACVMNHTIERQLALSWGITPIMMPYAKDSDELIDFSIASAEKAGLLTNGDLAVVTAGVPVGISGTSNMIKVELVGNCLLMGVGIGDQNACGEACVCHTLTDIQAKFKPGMVLVLPSTSNEMLDYMRDAAAIIVEQPGMSSHAAIAGLALGKPVIIGASAAHQKIEHGSRVIVNCANGTVENLIGKDLHH